MKRTGFLAKLVTVPALLTGATMLGNVASTPAVQPMEFEGEWQIAEGQVVASASQTYTTVLGADGAPVMPGIRHLFAGMFDGRYVTSMFRTGFPTQDVMQWARENGFDRFEVWGYGRVIFQDTLSAGKIPQGWPSLEFAGHIDAPGLIKP